MFFMIKFNATAKKEREIVQQYDYYPPFTRYKRASSLLEDREIITAMRYNFDIKNSLFEY